ncbi:hypothetical protein AB0D38_48400 [Streptomyces sp. NPDC048279]|uniref:hypothetical protein n=1 Tax=Streptomyces sp. NPDC048279 TaxID=3154714 RepID=UPI00343B7EEE
MARVAAWAGGGLARARLTGTFSARAGLGHSRRARPGGPFVLLRTLLRAAHRRGKR